MSNPPPSPFHISLSMISSPTSSISSGSSKVSSNKFKAGVSIANSSHVFSSLSLGLSPGQGSLAETGHHPSQGEKNQGSGDKGKAGKGQNQEARKRFAEQGRHSRYYISFLTVLYSKSCHSLPGGGGRAWADLHLMLLLTVGGLNWGTKEQVYASVNLPFHLSLMQWMWSLPLISSPLSHAGELWKGPSETRWDWFSCPCCVIIARPRTSAPREHVCPVEVWISTA